MASAPAKPSGHDAPGAMLYYSSRAAIKDKTFIGQAIVSVLINFGINFGFEWLAVSRWSRLPRGSFERLQIWYMNPNINSCIAMDLLLTAFFVAFFSMLLGSNGVVQEIKKGKCKPVDTSVTFEGYWRYTVVRVEGLCARSFANGIYFTVIAGVPTLLLLWACIQNGYISGEGYSAFKGLWAAALSLPVFVTVFFSAADSRNFEIVEYSQIATGPSSGGRSVPLVGGVSRV